MNLQKDLSNDFKIGFLGDLHLTNRLPYTHTDPNLSLLRKKRLIKFLNHLITTFIFEKVKLILIPGDLCHGTMLGPDDLDLLMQFLNLLRNSKIPTVIISGNHDLEGKNSILKFLEKNSSEIFYVKETWNDFYFFGNKIRVVAIDYCPEDKFIEIAEENMILRRKERYNILIGHVGIKHTLHGTTKSIYGIKKEDIEYLSKGYDLMLFGHHHKFQKIVPNGFYTGAVQQTRIDERDTIPGGGIISLPSLEIKRIENIFSPRFKVIEDYNLVPGEITDNIVKPILNLENKTEEENIKFLEDILVCNPYYLIRPRLKKALGLKNKSLKLRKIIKIKF